MTTPGGRVFMRALILLECLAVIALAVLILLKGSRGPESGAADVFQAHRVLLDATPGEVAKYRVDDGKSILEFKVLAAAPEGRIPRVSVTRMLWDAAGTQLPDPEPTYIHMFHKHGLFPFLTPEEPGAYDRVWILKRIQRSTIAWGGRTIPCWRVECIDPALPPDRDAVVVWLREEVPVTGSSAGSARPTG
jgi:hypothetical protein